MAETALNSAVNIQWETHHMLTAVASISAITFFWQCV